MRLVVALGAAVSTYVGENRACVLPGRERNEGEVFCEWQREGHLSEVPLFGH